MALPNCFLSLEYFKEALKEPLATPKERAAIDIRPPSNIFID